VLTGDERYRAQADALFADLLPIAQDNVFGHLSLLNALDLKLTGAQIVVVGRGPDADALLAAARRLPHATSIVLAASDAASLPAHHPAYAKAGSVRGAAAFVCRGQTCSLPVTDAQALDDLARSPAA
jgi:uncharacterized protein YyaL (SSP411 family)